MINDEKLKIFKDKYETKFDQALKNGNKKEANKLLEDWQREYETKSNNKRW